MLGSVQISPSVQQLDGLLSQTHVELPAFSVSIIAASSGEEPSLPAQQ